MICGALQTLNEEAFEDVVASERPSPTGGPSTGETIALTPIQETAEHERSLAYSNDDTTDRRQLDTISNSHNNYNNNNKSSHSFSLSNMNKGNPKNNSMVMAADKINNINANQNLNHVHDQIQSQSQSQSNQTNPLCNPLDMLDHESVIDNNHIAISSTFVSMSTVIVMPDAKAICPDSNVSIDDTRL